MSKKINTGAKLWDEAKKIIPGGNQLLSKRAEMFLPDQWPAYYKKASGCEIWDLDDNHYYDMSIMGIGTSPLGYAHPEITDAVKQAVDDGAMTSLNCFEEVELAKKLIELHPWAQGVRFTRSGGEACSIAVRIARAHTGKDKVAFCGYHGWHDWYLATNISGTENLSEQLLPGLSPAGVPKGLEGTALPFNAGDVDAFKQIVKDNGDDCGVVIMEVFRHDLPDLDFVRQIREICTENDMVLIFDEISSGFRLNTGASHLLWDVQPDICVLGKALGNGHPIAAIIGKQDVMDSAQQSFISSSYWTERVGYVAALETLKVFERDNVPQLIMETGRTLKSGLLEKAKKTNIELDVIGVDSVLILIFKHEGLVSKTLFTQEMLKKGFLAGNVIYVSVSHTPAIVEAYLNAVEDVFSTMSGLDAEQLEARLEGPVCHSGFRRLN